MISVCAIDCTSSVEVFWGVGKGVDQKECKVSVCGSSKREWLCWWLKNQTQEENLDHALPG